MMVFLIDQLPILQHLYGVKSNVSIQLTVVIQSDSSFAGRHQAVHLQATLVISNAREPSVSLYFSHRDTGLCK